MAGALGWATHARAAPPPKSAPLAPAAPARARLRVVCVGAHPGDPEAGCGGTLARYAEAGHAVTVLYVTRGEGQAPNAAHAGARSAEAEAACAALGAKPLFLSIQSGKLELTQASEALVRRALEAEKPDVLFAHWPIDTDSEHAIASALALRAYLALPHAFPLHFYEVMTGTQTLDFVPTAFVDISETREKKIRALKALTSQSFERIYEQSHEKLEAFRAREIAAFAAEAFRAFGPDAKSGGLPGL
jgi:LmbE family N-acetylglucosaminyl deacetylase